MTPRTVALVLLVIPGILPAGDQPTPVTSIPLKLGENYALYLSARINGSVLSCNLDSGGGDRIYLDKGRAAALGIQPTHEGRSANPQTAAMATDARAKVTLELGGLKLANQTLLMHDRPYAPFTCVIGLAVLQDYVVELDYNSPTLRVYDASRYQYSGSGHAAPLTRYEGNPLVSATLTFPKGDPIKVRMVVDTGGGRPAGYLTKSFIDQHGIMSRGLMTVPDFWSGFSGNRPRVLATRLEKLSVGAIELPRPIFFLWQVRGFGGATEPEGLLCSGFLRRFNLIFDYPHQRMIFEPGPHFGDEMPFDASGTLIYREGQNPFRVFKVIDGSPAAEAGLKEGDIVLEFDGKPARELSNSEIVDALMADGRECMIRVQRGDDILTMKLKLRRLI